MTPKSFSFGRLLRKSGAQTKKITITQGDGGPLALKLLGDTPKSIQAKLHEIEPGKRYELEVTLTPPFSSDRISTNLRLATGVPEAPAASIRVFASVKPRITALPSALRIPTERGRDWHETFALVWDDDKPLKISSVRIDNPQLTVRLDEQGGKQVVVLQPLVDYSPKPRRQYITLVTDDPETPEVRVPIMISTKGRGRVAASKTRPLHKPREVKTVKPEAEVTPKETTEAATAKHPEAAPEPAPK